MKAKKFINGLVRKSIETVEAYEEALELVTEYEAKPKVLFGEFDKNEAEI